MCLYLGLEVVIFIGLWGGDDLVIVLKGVWRLCNRRNWLMVRFELWWEGGRRSLLMFFFCNYCSYWCEWRVLYLWLYVRLSLLVIGRWFCFVWSNCDLLWYWVNLRFVIVDVRWLVRCRMDMFVVIEMVVYRLVVDVVRLLGFVMMILVDLIVLIDVWWWLRFWMVDLVLRLE